MSQLLVLGFLRSYLPLVVASSSERTSCIERSEITACCTPSGPVNSSSHVSTGRALEAIGSSAMFPLPRASCALGPKQIILRRGASSFISGDKQALVSQHLAGHARCVVECRDQSLHQRLSSAMWQSAQPQIQILQLGLASAYRSGSLA